MLLSNQIQKSKDTVLTCNLTVKNSVIFLSSDFRNSVVSKIEICVVSLFYSPTMTRKQWSVGQNVEQLEHSLQVGMKNDTITLGNSLEVSCNVKQIPTLRPKKKSRINIYSREMKIYVYKRFVPDVCSIFIHYLPKRETTQTSFNTWMNE